MDILILIKKNSRKIKSSIGGHRFLKMYMDIEIPK